MISLIACTLHRVAEMERLIGSLARQSRRDFELLVIDQNPDDRLRPVLARHAGLEIRHLRSERGLSRARNVGLGAARGELLAFPDDDCWYPGNLLGAVEGWFGSHPGFALLGTALRTAGNEPATRKPATAQRCARAEVSKCVSSATLFLRREVVSAVGGFNENLGIGAPSPYQAGEERDYVLRALACGFEMWYEPGLTVYHPSLYSIEHQRRNTYVSALSEGCVQRLHGYPLHRVGGELARSFGGAAIRLCQGDWFRAQVCGLRGAGQLVGYVSGPADLERRSGEGRAPSPGRAPLAGS
jgi:glycosyltransferase involved in cell wall biosynthesis